MQGGSLQQPRLYVTSETGSIGGLQTNFNFLADVLIQIGAQVLF